MSAISSHLSTEAQAIVHLAREFSRQYGLNCVGTEQLVLGILCEPEGLGAKILNDLGIDEDQAKECIDELIQDRLEKTWVLGRSPGTPYFRSVMNRAAALSKGTGNWQVRSEHLLAAIMSEKNCTGYKALVAMGVTPEVFRAAMRAERESRAAVVR